MDNMKSVLSFSFKGERLEVKNPTIYYYYPQGKWYCAYKIEVDNSCRITSNNVGGDIVYEIEVMADKVTLVKPHWWRRLLFPIYRVWMDRFVYGRKGIEYNAD